MRGVPDAGVSQRLVQESVTRENPYRPLPQFVPFDVLRYKPGLEIRLETGREVFAKAGMRKPYPDHLPNHSFKTC
jgi:hypothetical protein